MSGEDIHFDAPFSAEVKSREKCVVEKWLKQAEKNAPEGKTPLLIVHIHGSRHENDMVVLRMKDYIQWYGKPGCSVCQDPSLTGAF